MFSHEGNEKHSAVSCYIVCLGICEAAKAYRKE